ncbi:DUF6443 domain-containing protein [uncultured Bacteroides sp.]|uniref:DUF6443 domain-containing protein n=1 Tax=uncultured Bacteroides sp. TaxID=162156 RepID=UPI002AA75214|nr:DUF6443 domain-containing protein [uncultured Bacteroides sp.]
MRLAKLNIRLSKYRIFIILSLLLFLVVTQYSYAQSTTQNYILSRTMTDSTGTKYMDVIQYYDGLGRPVQKVQKDFTPGKDLVTVQEYDDYGRESNLWLPTPYSGNGNYTDPAIIFSESVSSYADNSPYSSVIYENSPLNRVMQKYGPGNSWRDARRCVRDTFYTNNSSDTLRCAYYHVTSDNQLARSGNYDNSQLYVTRTMDEDYHKIFEFKDKLGQIILTRQINNNQNHDTYYVYDDFGNKCFVLPPIAADSLTENKVYPNSDGILNRYAYLYKHDFRNRCVWKKLPGAEGINMVYDKADHLIYSQDGEQCKRGEWTFNIPDVFNRTVITGLCSDTISVKNQVVSCNLIDGTSGFLNTGYQLSNQINSATRLLKVEYYDNYNYMHLLPDTLQSKLGYVALNDYSQQYVNTNSGISAKGMYTGSRVFMLEDASKAIITAMYYDSRGRLAQSRSTNHLGGYEYDWYSYTFTGQIDKHRHDHSGLANVKEVSRNYYDQAERLIKTTHSLNDATPVTLLEKTYNDLGQLKTQATGGFIHCNYTYNLRGWVTGINALDVYEATFYYNTKNQEHPNTLCYNGNISSMDWLATLYNNSYCYKYDDLNRLLAADYLNKDAMKYVPLYSERETYDKQGNITSLYREGLSKFSGIQSGEYNRGQQIFGVIDNLTYRYDGNHLKCLGDAAAPLRYHGAYDFKDGAHLGTEYYYDKNGNIVSDLNKNISTIKYNVLNLPSIIQLSYGHMINYLYSADGAKRKIKYVTSNENLYVPLGGSIEVPSGNILSVTNTDYCGNIIYENGKISMLLTDNGYVNFKDSTPRYYYYQKDYLGSNVFDFFYDKDLTSSDSDFYPFGLKFGQTPADKGISYKYNGKELDRMHGLDLYDYGARYYDPAIGRWGVMDPLAEKYYSISPYAYCMNNPVNAIDPTGMSASPIYNEDGDLLGTDNQGLKGEAIVMNEANFKQNMSHKDALKNDLGQSALNNEAARNKFSSSYSNLSSRPDYDGVMSYKELLQWGRENGNSPVYLDASKINLGNLYVSDFKGVGKGQLVNTTTILNTPLDTYGPWGKNYMTLISSDGKVKLHADIFDYDQHSLSKAWKEGAGTWTYEFFIRHPFISILQTVHGVDNKFGFPLRPYGYGQLKTEPSVLMKIFNAIGNGASSIKP